MRPVVDAVCVVEASDSLFHGSVSLRGARTRYPHSSIDESVMILSPLLAGDRNCLVFSNFFGLMLRPHSAMMSIHIVVDVRFARPLGELELHFCLYDKTMLTLL